MLLLNHRCLPHHFSVCFLNSILLGLQAPPLVPISTNISIMRPNAVVTSWNMQYFYTGTAWFLGSFNNHTFVFEELSGASGSSGLNGAVISISSNSSAGHSHFLILQYKYITILNLVTIEGLLHKTIRSWLIVFFSFFCCFPMYLARAVDVTFLPRQKYIRGAMKQ